jgi:hypothetical protein
MVGKVLTAGGDDVGREWYRISLLLDGRWNSEAAHGARESCFYRVGLRKRAQTGRAHVPLCRGRYRDKHHNHRE